MQLEDWKISILLRIKTSLKQAAQRLAISKSLRFRFAVWFCWFMQAFRVDSRFKLGNIADRFHGYSCIKLAQFLWILNCLLSLAKYVHVQEKYM